MAKSKITTEIPERTLNGLKLYEVMQIVGGGFDISDKDYDWGIYCECEKNWKSCDDWYDRFILLICLNITCVSYSENWYSECNVREFIIDNLEAFEKFCNEENRDDYKPQYWKDKGEKIDPEADENELFYEIYMQTMESLIAGNYCDEDYHKLYCYLTGDEYTERKEEPEDGRD